MTVYDDEESGDDEDRWITLGLIRGQHYLVVIHTYRNADAESVTIRLISARAATKHEIRQYQQG